MGQGKLATLILTDGDVLEVTSNVKRAWIDGREIDLSNKQTNHRDKYRDKYQPVTYTHLRAHETVRELVCRLRLEKTKQH